jgi:thymidine phosphorylase
MIYLAGLSKTHKEGIDKAKKALDSGAALEKFRELIKEQGGDIRVIDDYSLFPHTELIFEVRSLKSGFISKMDCKALGMHCVQLGGGRQKTSDVIDFASGFIMSKKIGDQVKKGDILAVIHHHKNQMELAKNIASSMIKKDITIQASKPRAKKKLILEIQTKFAPNTKTKSKIKSKR